MRALYAAVARFAGLVLFIAAQAEAQEPAAWGAAGRDALEFHTFSIAAIDPRTGEVGVAVTTRVPCVGNGVPWVRAGVGAVATQANTRTEYGQILLDALAKGDEPSRALERALAADSQAVSRQGRTQSAAVVVADSRPGRSRRADGITANINICENPEPVAELRRIYNTISQTLGFRQVEQFTGNDIWQLKVMLHALGLFRPNETELKRDTPDALIYTPEAMAAVDAFRGAEKLSLPAAGSPSGLVDDDTVARLWAALQRAGKADAVRSALLETTAVRR